MRGPGGGGGRDLRLTAALLLLALFALLTALVILSVLRLFCHDPSRCLYAARNCNQSFWNGAKKTGGVHGLADRRVDAGVGASPAVCFQTVYPRERFGSVIHWRQVTVFFEAVILLGVSFIPGGDFNLLANCLTSFACGMQVESFRKIHGHGIATTMCIGNLRNALQNVDDYIITHKRGFLENGLLYFGVIFTFVFGAVLGNWCIERMGLHAIAVASVLLFIAFAIMFIDRERDLRFRWKVAAEAWKEGCRK